MMAAPQPRRHEPGPLTNPTVQEIDYLIDAGHFARAAELARWHRDRTMNQGLRRRYTGLMLFAESRMPKAVRSA